MTPPRDGDGAARPFLRTVGAGLAAVVVAALCTSPAVARNHGGQNNGGQNNGGDNFAPASRTVAPVKVTRTTGSVKDSGNVLRGRTTTLTGHGSSVTLDFGKEVGGIPSVRFAGTSAAGQRLGLAFTESSLYIGATSDASNGGPGPDGALTADVVPGSTWTAPKAKQRGGFRYLTLFVDSEGSIALDRVSVAITFAPTMTDLRDYENYFHSSDPLLNRIWYAGAYTVQTNIIAPDTGRVWGPPGEGWDNGATVGVGDAILVDGAKRDRTVWPGDLGVSVPTEFASLGDVTPTRNALTTLYQHQTAAGELPFAGPQVNFYSSDTYHLWTLVGTANYVQYSHDEAWLRDTWASYRRAVDFSLAKVGPSGLLRVTGPNDWARGGQGGENIAANALLYQALLTGAELADLVRDPAASAWRTTAAGVKSAVNATLWDEAAGLFRDNPTSALHPQDGNSLAVWFGLTDSARARRISASLTLNWNAYGATTPEKNSEIGTFPGSLEVQAHLRAGDTTRALELIRREWGYMLDSPIGTGSTFWEGYLANGQPGYGGAYMSLAHGWATGPTSALTFSVLGIQPQSVGGGYLVKPQPGDLTSAEGSLKTPLGDIELAWKHDARHGSFSGRLTAPTAAVDRVEIPTFGAKTTLRVNGRLVWDGTRGLAYGAHLDDGHVVLRGLPSRAVLDSRTIGGTASGLGVRVTSSGSAPVRAGEDRTIAVTVTAEGSKALSGKVDATVPAGWTTTPATFALDPARGSTSTVVTVGVRAPAGGNGGQPEIRLTATSGKLKAETSTSLTVFGNWPAGVTAEASSEAAPNVFEGQPRTYYAGNAIDRNPATFWNDASPGQFPDTLTLSTPSPVALSGVGFQSIVDGVVTDFVVQTWDGTAWTTRATVTGNTALVRWVPFDQPVTTSRVRFTATGSQPQNGNYTRVAELTP